MFGPWRQALLVWLSGIISSTVYRENAHRSVTTPCRESNLSAEMIKASLRMYGSRSTSGKAWKALVDLFRRRWPQQINRSRLRCGAYYCPSFSVAMVTSKEQGATGPQARGTSLVSAVLLDLPFCPGFRSWEHANSTEQGLTHFRKTVNFLQWGMCANHSELKKKIEIWTNTSYKIRAIQLCVFGVKATLRNISYNQDTSAH